MGGEEEEEEVGTAGGDWLCRRGGQRSRKGSVLVSALFCDRQERGTFNTAAIRVYPRTHVPDSAVEHFENTFR